jgi:hypothetical protein
VSRAVLAQYAGNYEVEMLGMWTVSVEGDELMIQMADGGGKQPTIAQSDTVFVFPTVGGSMRFVTDGQGRATHFFLTIVEGGCQGDAEVTFDYPHARFIHGPESREFEAPAPFDYLGKAIYRVVRPR